MHTKGRPTDKHKRMIAADRCQWDTREDWTGRFAGGIDPCHRRERGRRPFSVGQCEWSLWTLGSVLFLPGEHMDGYAVHGDCTDVVTHVRWQWKGGGEGGAGRRVHQVLWLLWAEYIITHWQCTGYDSYLDNNVTWLFKGIKKTCSKGVGCVKILRQNKRRTEMGKSGQGSRHELNWTSFKGRYWETVSRG